MKFFKTKKRILITALILLFTALIIRRIHCENAVFYNPDYEKEDISSIICKDVITDDEYMHIFRQTGVSPAAAKKLIKNGEFSVLKELNELYFKEPVFKKEYIARPFTLQEINAYQSTPFADIKDGDILITFNTRTLDWRHGHCAIVLDAENGVLLEHMAIGELSCKTTLDGWGFYPAFAVLRHRSEKAAHKAAAYAEKELVGISYNLFAGLLKKDKVNVSKPSSHCSHIVWQAFKAAGIDIDNDGGAIVTPYDIALSPNLQLVQLYGLEPKIFENRICK